MKESNCTVKLTIGKMCRDKRVERGLRQQDVADATGYSVENISAFENGRNSNYMILMWYVEHGLDLGEFYE